MTFYYRVFQGWSLLCWFTGWRTLKSQKKKREEKIGYVSAYSLKLIWSEGNKGENDAFTNVRQYFSVLYLSVEVISASIVNVWLTHPVNNNILESIHVNPLCQQKSSFLCILVTSALHFHPFENCSWSWKTKRGVITPDEP